ncbi:hypothetical protein QG37_02732 [Candidozyma auris]|nr:hypothetical protein QG37_02732 [[Candida] auris]
MNHLLQDFESCFVQPLFMYGVYGFSFSAGVHQPRWKNENVFDPQDIDLPSFFDPSDLRVPYFVLVQSPLF